MIPSAWRQGEVAVVGLGRSGIAASQWLVTHGIAVYASDVASTSWLQKSSEHLIGLGVDIDLGRHDVSRIERAQAVVVSPGVPPDAAPIVAARRAGVEVVAELDLGIRILDGSSLIAVTGTNGKTTTTALIAHLLDAAGVCAAAVGNIGRPLTDLASSATRPEWIAVEVSSFQLHDAPHLAPAIGVLTNLAPDHLDRYANAASYYEDKKRLFQNADDASVWVLNADDAGVLRLAEGARGTHRHWSLEGTANAWYAREERRLVVEGCTLLPRSELRLLGDHNVANALAATLAVLATGVPLDTVARGLETFSALPHRLEPIRTVNGVQWINDSKATNVSAALVGARAMTQPYILILGGRPKGERFGSLRPDRRCKHVIAYGEARQLIADDLKPSQDIEVVERFDDAVLRARDHARPGDVVLLSPACASFDQFESFAARGDQFRTIVEGL